MGLYLLEKFENESVKREATSVPPFGPGFDKILVEQANRMEIWATNFSDPLEYTEFRLYSNNKLLATKRRAGY